MLLLSRNDKLKVNQPCGYNSQLTALLSHARTHARTHAHTKIQVIYMQIGEEWTKGSIINHPLLMVTCHDNIYFGLNKLSRPVPTVFFFSFFWVNVVGGANSNGRSHVSKGIVNRPTSCFLLPRTQSRVIELPVVSSNTLGGGVHTE